METEVEAPFYFQEWIERNRQNIDKEGRLSLFGDKYQVKVKSYPVYLDINVYGPYFWSF